MRKLFRPYLAFFLLGSFLVTATSCKDDDGPTPPPTEEIAKARFTLTPQDDQKGMERKVEYTEAKPTPTMLPLLQNVTYTGKLELFDADDNPINVVGETHEVFYEVLDGLNLTITKTDTDKNGRPIGLITTAITGTAPSNGKLKVTLKHQPNKGSTSDPNKGETDLSMTITMFIEN